MSAWGTAADQPGTTGSDSWYESQLLGTSNFAAYPLFYLDSALSLVGIKSPALDAKVSAAEQASGDVGPAGNVDAGAAAVAASQADQLADITQSVQTSLPTPVVDVTTIPSWVWWTIGGLGTLAALAALAPYAGLVRR